MLTILIVTTVFPLFNAQVSIHFMQAADLASIKELESILSNAGTVVLKPLV